MITLLRGDDRALRVESDRVVAAASGRSSATFCLPLGFSQCPRAWNGLREFLRRLRQLWGQTEVDRVVARHRAGLSLVPGEWRGELDDQQRLERRLFAARLTSHLSHNFLVQGPLFVALASFVHDLAQQRNFTLVCPDLAHLDRETLGLLRTLYRRFPDTAPSLIVGFDPRRRTPEPDARGLIWRQPADDVWQVALGFMALPETEVRDLAGSSAERAEAQVADLDQAASDQGLDSLAFAALDARPEGCDADLAVQVVDAMRTAFAGFAFTTTLRLGLSLFERQPVLTQEQAADAHALLALAAHNRQFRSRGNLKLAELLQHHLESALEVETRPGHRSALSYRLAVTTARRKKDFEAGLLWADRAIGEAGSSKIDPVEAANLESWGRNIRAFALTGVDRLEEAAVECEMAYQRLGAVLETRPAALKALDAGLREVVFSRSLMADNLAAVAQMAGDPERLEIWKRIADELNKAVPDLERYEARHWIALYRRKLRLAAAADKASRGLGAARAGQDALREYRYTVELADLKYRLGDAKAALDGFERAGELRLRLGEPDFLRPVRLSAAAAAMRVGRVDQARSLVVQALAALNSGFDSSMANDGRAQMLAFLGRLAARNGDANEAEFRLNEAIELAVESGERDTLLFVAVAAGRASQRLGDVADAFQAYRQALEIATVMDTESGPALSNAPAALEMAARLGLWETGEQLPEHVIRCLHLLSEALADAEAWWDLARFSRIVSACVESGIELPETSEAQVALRLAVAQREPSR